MTAPQRIFDHLDAVSRRRALTLEESLQLERAIKDIGTSSRKAWPENTEARFFDRIANGASISEAAVSVGKTPRAGLGKFQRVCRKYGWQAA